MWPTRYHVAYTRRYDWRCVSHAAAVKLAAYFDVLLTVHLSIILAINQLNRLTPNDPYTGRIATLTSKRCILYIYSTNTGTEHFKHALYSPFFSLQNAVCFITLTCLVPVLFTFHIQSVLQLKEIIPAPKG